jgi:fatty acid desaturase
MPDRPKRTRLPWIIAAWITAALALLGIAVAFFQSNIFLLMVCIFKGCDV